MSQRHKYILISILVISALYFIEKYVNKELEEYPEITAKDREPSEEFGEDLFPKSTTNSVIHHAYYSLSYSEPHEQSEWVAYELKKEHLSYNDFERPYFVEDREVPTGSADWRNYKNSGYDRGHLCPAGDRRFSYEAYLETFLTSNISPMNHEFNRGVWNDLEKQVRRWAKKKDGVFVVTGGILSEGGIRIGEEAVSVPTAFYKIILNHSEKGWEAIAFMIPNEEVSDSYRNYVTSIDAIESLTEIDFFPNMTESVENDLEAKIRTTNWF